ncbi:hypothetical protein ABGB14_38510 [Nonomuraea sp. B10E15]|uniref:hypothetical protein n=1 Tax=Nonomuraea sp. B10E15 TaxID=3153560 RepID=UPI00325D6D0B
MLAELHAAHADEDERGRGERAEGETGGHLAEDGGPGDLGRLDAEAAGGLRQHGQHAEVVGVGGEDEAERHAGDRHEQRQVAAEGVGDDPDERGGHLVDHLGPGEDAGEDAGREDHGGDQDDAPGVLVEQRLLLLPGGEVDDGGDREADDEQHRQRHHLQDQRDQQHDGEHEVERGQGRAAALGGEARAGPVTAYRPGPCLDLCLDLCRDLCLGPGLGGQAHGAQAAAFPQPDQVRRHQHPDDARGHGGQHGGEHLGAVQLQHRHRAGGRAAPRDHVHHAGAQADDTGQHEGAHVEPLVDGQQGRDGDEERGGPVAVEGHAHGEDGGADGDAQRIVLGQAQDAPDQRIEQAGGSASPAWSPWPPTRRSRPCCSPG